MFSTPLVVGEGETPRVRTRREARTGPRLVTLTPSPTVSCQKRVSKGKVPLLTFRGVEFPLYSNLLHESLGVCRCLNKTNEVSSPRRRERSGEGSHLYLLPDLPRVSPPVRPEGVCRRPQGDKVRVESDFVLSHTSLPKP